MKNSLTKKKTSYILLLMFLFIARNFGMNSNNRTAVIKNIVWDILYIYEIILIVGANHWLPITLLGLLGIMGNVLLLRTERGRKELTSPVVCTDKNNLILLSALTLANSHQIEFLIKVTLLIIAVIYVFWDSYERAKKKNSK